MLVYICFAVLGHVHLPVGARWFHGLQQWRCIVLVLERTWIWGLDQWAEWWWLLYQRRKNSNTPGKKDITMKTPGHGFLKVISRLVWINEEGEDQVQTFPNILVGLINKWPSFKLEKKNSMIQILVHVVIDRTKSEYEI